MDYRVDEKGKFFTEHVTKRSLAVTACVRDWIVHGRVHLRGDNRLKDELNDGETFIAVTAAQVWEAHGERPIYETPVLIVHKEQIVWIFPHESASPPPDTTDASEPQEG